MDPNSRTSTSGQMVTSNRRWGLRCRTYACRRATALIRSHGRFIGPAGARLGRSGLTAGARSWAIGLLGTRCGASFVGQMEEHRLEVVAAEPGGHLVGRAVGHDAPRRHEHDALAESLDLDHVVA